METEGFFDEGMLFCSISVPNYNQEGWTKTKGDYLKHRVYFFVLFTEQWVRIK